MHYVIATLNERNVSLPMQKTSFVSFLSEIQLDVMINYREELDNFKNKLLVEQDRFAAILFLNMLSNILFRDRDIAAVYSFFQTYALNPTAMLTDHTEPVFSYLDVNSDEVIEGSEVKFRVTDTLDILSSKVDSAVKSFMHHFANSFVFKSVVETFFIYKKENIGGMIDSISSSEISGLLYFHMNKKDKI